MITEQLFPTITGEHWKRSLAVARKLTNSVSEQIKSLVKPEMVISGQHQTDSPHHQQSVT